MNVINCYRAALYLPAVSHAGCRINSIHKNENQGTDELHVTATSSGFCTIKLMINAQWMHLCDSNVPVWRPLLAVALMMDTQHQFLMCASAARHLGLLHVAAECGWYVGLQLDGPCMLSTPTA